MSRKSVYSKMLLVFVLAACLCFAAVNSASVRADARDDFDALLEELYRDGAISSTNGETTAYNDYEDSWAQLGWYQYLPFQEANRFVFAANVAWASASATPNNYESGCGLTFNMDNQRTENHLFVSIRMDGLIYFTGVRNYTPLSYGTYRYGSASTKGSADFVLVVDRDKATVYINGNRVVRKADLPVMGNLVGLVTLSGTNKDFGTRCSWSDIFFYSW